MTYRNVAQKVINNTPIVLAVIFLTILTWSSSLYGANLDEGMIWSSAMKVANGQVMYRDFFEFWTPGTVYVMGGLIKLFGPYLWVSRGLYIISSLVLYLGLYMVLWLAGFTKIVRVVSVALFASIGMTYLAVNHHWFGLIGVLATIYWLLSFYRSSLISSRHLRLAGLVAALTALFMQYEGVVAISGGVAAILLLSSRSLWLRHLSWFCVPIILIGIITVGFFAVQGAGPHLWYSTVHFPLFQYKNANAGLPSAIWLYQSILLMLASVVIIRRHHLSPSLRILIVFATLMQLVGLATTSFMHAFVLGVLTNAILVYALSLVLNKQRITRAWSQVIHFADMMATIDTKRFATNLLLSLFVFIYTVRVLQGIATLWSDLLIPRQQVTLPAGQVLVAIPIAQRLDTISTFITTHTKAEQPVYFGPYSSYYNFLLQRSNPISYSQLTPGYNTQEMFTHAVTELEQQKPEYIVLLPRESVFPFGAQNQLYEYITKHYRIAYKLKPLPISQRRAMDKEPEDAIWQRR